VLALTGNANALVVFAIGVALWLVGHGHYALRHGEYRARWPPSSFPGVHATGFPSALIKTIDLSGLTRQRAANWRVVYPSWLGQERKEARQAEQVLGRVGSTRPRPFP